MITRHGVVFIVRTWYRRSLPCCCHPPPARSRSSIPSQPEQWSWNWKRKDDFLLTRGRGNLLSSRGSWGSSKNSVSLTYSPGMTTFPLRTLFNPMDWLTHIEPVCGLMVGAVQLIRPHGRESRHLIIRNIYVSIRPKLWKKMMYCFWILDHYLNTLETFIVSAPVKTLDFRLGLGLGLDNNLTLPGSGHQWMFSQGWSALSGRACSGSRCSPRHTRSLHSPIIVS